MLKLLIAGFIVYGVFALAAPWLADRLMFFPPPPSYGSQTFPWVRVPAGENGSIALAHLPNPDATYTILYSHGNAEDLGHVLPLLEYLRDLGFGVIGYDYRGYGESTGGPPTAAKATADAEAAWAYATGTLGISPDRLVVYGASVGSGPAIELAARHAPAGLVLQGAFTSAIRVMTQVRVLPFDRFENLRRLRAVDCPVLVIHGARDEVIPFAHGKRLFDAVDGPKQSLWVEDARHNDLLLVAGARVATALRQFIGLLQSLTP